MNRRIGVCSWSLKPESPEDLVAKLSAVGVDCVQLALDPIRNGHWPLSRTAALLRDAGIQIRSGMIAMHGEDYSTLESIRRTGGLAVDEHWPRNLQAAEENAEIAARLGLPLVTFHAGFVPEDRGDRRRSVLLHRLRTVVERFDDAGARVGIESGPEPAETMVEFIRELDHGSVGVNFDPANMILYGNGDPIGALEQCTRHVLQVHMKDALPAKRVDEWGSEVCAGKGRVDWEAFFGTLSARFVPCDVMIEREAGATRVEDIRAARELAERFA